MIPFDFEYYRPESAEEAVNLFHDLSARGKEPTYYGGGTEIISFSRLYQLYPKAVIDLKGIPEGQVIETQGDKIVIGGAVTLGKIQATNIFPLLSWAGGRVADHTVRNQITLGGNLCARIPYREAILPLLLADSELLIAGTNGLSKVSLGQCFNKSIKLPAGEFILQVIIPENFAQKPFISLKKTAQGDVTYPQDSIGYPLTFLCSPKN